MRVLFAGASGVIGRYAVPMLIDAGYDVWALSRRRHYAAESVSADALDLSSVARVVQQIEPDIIVNMLTAIPDPLDPRNMTQEMAATNRLRTEATANLIEAAASARIICQGLAYVYDPEDEGTGDARNEAAPLWRQPPAQFASVVAALRAMEDQVTEAHGVVLRLGHLYGRGSSYAIDGGLTHLVRAGRVPLVGNGDSVFSFVHAFDVASAILAATDQSFIGTVNIVDDKPARISDWLPAMAAMLDAPEPKSVPSALARLLPRSWGLQLMTGLVGASNARAAAELGWHPRYPCWRDGFSAELRSSLN